MSQKSRPQAAAAYRVARRRATRAGATTSPPTTSPPAHAVRFDVPLPVGDVVSSILGAGFVNSPQGARLFERHAALLGRCDVLLREVMHLVSFDRLRQVYRAPLRSERQVLPAVYELQVAALLAGFARDLELHPRQPSGRHSDFLVRFLSQRFCVEVKTHEPQVRQGVAAQALGSEHEAESLLAAATRQCSSTLPNLVVLGCLEPTAVANVGLGSTQRIAAIAWMHVPAQAPGTWTARLHRLPNAERPFPAPLFEVLCLHFGCEAPSGGE